MTLLDFHFHHFHHFYLFYLFILLPRPTATPSKIEGEILSACNGCQQGGVVVLENTVMLEESFTPEG